MDDFDLRLKSDKEIAYNFHRISKVIPAVDLMGFTTHNGIGS